MTDEQIIARYAGTSLEDALVWASTQNGATTENPPVATDMDRYEIQRVFLADGLISDEISLQAEWELTGAGHRIAQRLQQSRQTGPLRRASTQKALLRFIDDEEPSATMDFVGS